MKFLVYVLYSASLDKFYIGFTADDIIERLKKHNSNHKGFTSGYRDWTVYYTESYDLKSNAIKREKQLKAWKSKVRIAQLVKKIPT